MLIKRNHELLPDNLAKVPVGKNHFAVIDACNSPWLSKYHWRYTRSSHCYYATRREIRNGKTITIRMHNEIMHTPKGMECHHRNLNPLDNRESNLENLTPPDHHQRHGRS
jgi:hypothetical protein